MKKIGIAIFVVALVVGSVFANIFNFWRIDTPGFFNISFGRGHRGSGNVVVEDRGLAGFKAINVSGVFSLEVTAQKEYSVKVEADDNLQAVIKTEVIDGVLQISTEDSIRRGGRLKVLVSAPDIEKVDSSGASKISIADIKNSALLIDTSGASKVTVAGETERLTIRTSGASKIDAENLKAVDADVSSSGAGKMTVNATGDLKVRASGAAKIAYVGEPRSIEKSISGVGKVEKK
jgi:hypothetical protein